MILHYNPIPLASPLLSIRVQAYSSSLHPPTPSSLGRELMGIPAGLSKGVPPGVLVGSGLEVSTPTAWRRSHSYHQKIPPLLFLPFPIFFYFRTHFFTALVLSFLHPNSSQINALLVLASHATTSSKATHIQPSLLPNTTGVPILPPSHQRMVIPMMLHRVQLVVQNIHAVKLFTSNSGWLDLRSYYMHTFLL